MAVDGAARQARPLPDAGTVGFTMFSCFGGAQALAELAERLDHQPLRDALVAPSGRGALALALLITWAGVASQRSALQADDPAG